jgi:outer membrane lipoprotein SlyB
MGVSSPNRVLNVHLMADFLNGYQIAPGRDASRSTRPSARARPTRGFLEGQAIENGLLVPSIGGGVCQVATTVFDAAIAGGYRGRRAAEPQLLHRSLPDRPRRDGGRRRTRLRLHEQHGPHGDRADVLHGTSR